MGRRKEIPLNHYVKAKLAVLWKNNPNKWRQYHEIRNHLKAFPEFKKISERTIIRYINQLCAEGFLEKRVELNHRTWYKPKSSDEIQRFTLIEQIHKMDGTLLAFFDAVAYVEPYIKILEQLACQRGASTHQLARQLNIPQAEMTEYLTTLQAAGFIEAIGEGWQLDFETLLAVCRFNALIPEKVSEIAKAYRDSWIIFQEWEGLTSDEEVTELLLEGISRAASFSLSDFEKIADVIKRAQETLKWKEEEVKEKERELKGLDEEESGEEKFQQKTDDWLEKIAAEAERHRKAVATMAALFLNIVFEFGFYKALIEKNEPLVKLWRICAKTPALRDFILEQIEKQKQKLQTIEEFTKFIKQLAIEEAVKA